MYPGNFGVYDFNGYVPEGLIGAALAIVLVCVGIALLSMAYSIVMYALHSLGLFTIAKRRGIHNPWLSWVPVANVWILGSISDQYQYVAKGKIRNRRKLLIGLNIAACVLMILFWIFYIVIMIRSAGSVFGQMAGETQILRTVLQMLGASGVMSVIAILTAVFQYIAYYDLFQSCNPNNSSAFLVLSILFNFLLPIFVFVSRKKDLGMPPRRSAAAEPEQKPEVIHVDPVESDVVEAQEEDFEE